MFEDIISIMNDKIADVDKKVEEATLEMSRRITEERTNAYKDLYKEAVDSFYMWGGYKGIYPRQYSLYNLATFIPFDTYIEIEVSDANMTHMRNGGSLFEHVYINGYHGGAMNSETGAYMYRYPVGVWNKWGLFARKTESVDSMFAESISEWDSTELVPLANKIGTEIFSKIEF